MARTNLSKLKAFHSLTMCSTYYKVLQYVVLECDVVHWQVHECAIVIYYLPRCIFVITRRYKAIAFMNHLKIEYSQLWSQNICTKMTLTVFVPPLPSQNLDRVFQRGRYPEAGTTHFMRKIEVDGEGESLYCLLFWSADTAAETRTAFALL